MTDLTVSDVEVWGFNGQATTGCGYSLPILRDKARDRYCLYSVTHPGGPWWSSRAEIEEQVHLGRVSPLPTPLRFSESPSPPEEQPVVVWVDEAFLSELDGTGLPLMQAGWVPQSVPDTRPSQLWACCIPTAAATQLLDDCAREFVRQFDERLVAENPAWEEVERLADLGLCAARDPATRYQLFKRYCAAMYYRPGGHPERTNQVFRLLVRNEFKSVTWDRFREDMAVVVERSRDVLRFRSATVSSVEPRGTIAADVPVHVEEFVAEIRDTDLGPEEFTRDVPYASPKALSKLDKAGVVRPGTYVRPGDILVGKVSPKPRDELTPEEKLLHTVFGRPGEGVRNDSLEVPAGVEGVVVAVHRSDRQVKVYVTSSRTIVPETQTGAGPGAWVEGDLDKSLAELELSVRATNILECEGISTVRDLVTRTEDDLLEVRNFGETTLREVKAKLQERGLSLGRGSRPSTADPSTRR